MRIKLSEEISENETIVIFGAGIVAYYVAKYLKSLSYNVVGFLVSKEEDNFPGTFGYEVTHLEYYKDHDCKTLTVIVATLERLHEEIKNVIEGYAFGRVVFVKNDDYYKLRRIYLDSDADILHSVYRLELEFDVMQKEIKKIASTVRSNEFDYSKKEAFHNEQYKKDFIQFRKSDLVEESVFRLCSGMDFQSKCEIYKIVHRLNQLCDGMEIPFDDDERCKVKKLADFYNSIYRISQNKVILNGWIFPAKARLEASVLYYRNGISDLDNHSLSPDKVIIDAGAYIGDSAIVLSNEFKDNHIYAFECEHNNVATMKDVLKWNNVTNVTPIEMALMDYCGEMTLYSGEDELCTYNGAIKYETGRYSCGITVRTTTLDLFAQENSLDIGMIKVDIEGAEKSLLKGAKTIISEQHPTLIISIYHSIDDFFTIKTMIEEMYDGYSMRIFRPILEHSFIEETALICEDARKN